MKLKAIALTAMLMGAGVAFAAPTLQQCAPMEVTHNGGSGLSYSLVCDAGGWNLKYTGSVPSGTEAVLAHYRVQVSNPDGSNFTQNRAVRLPSPAMLGQALIREAVLLDNGDVALRDCPDFGCTLYRPLGGTEKLAKATITVTPEVKRLSDEAARLQADLAQRKDEVARQAGVVTELQGEVQRLTQKIAETEQALSAAKAAHAAELASAKDQYAADISGLMASSAAELAKSLEARDAQHRAAVDELTLKLANAEKALAQAEQGLSQATASHQSVLAEKNAAQTLVADHAAQVAQLQASLTAAQHKLEEQARLTKEAQGLSDQASDAHATAAEALKAQLAQESEKVAALNLKVEELERLVASANEALVAAQKAKANNSAQGADQLAQEKAAHVAQLAEAQASLAQAQSALEEARAAHQTEVAGLTEKLARANEQASSEAQAQVAEAATSRENSSAEVARLNGEIQKLTAKMEQLAGERQEALLVGKQVAEDMLEMLDGVELIEKAKVDAEKALEATNNKLMELSAKLEAAQLARELAMQAATAAHADADAQNIKNQELAQRLARAEEALRSTGEARKGDVTQMEEALNAALSVLQGEKDRNASLESKAAAQEQELAILRHQLAALRGELPPAAPVPAPAPDEQK